MICFKQLEFGYQKATPLGCISSQFSQGEKIALIGSNGSGKSTLLRTIAGFLPPLSGNISYTQLSAKPKLSYLPQYVEFDKTFPISVAQMLAMGMINTIGLYKAVTAEQKQLIQSALHQVGLADYLEKSIATLSGGQMQRVLFARLLLEQADVILLDESFSGVDLQNIHLLLNILDELKQRGSTIIASTHNWDLVKQHFDKVIWLQPADIVIGLAADVVEPPDCCETTN